MVLLFVGFTIRYLYEYRKYLLDIYYIQNISMCRNTEKKCMHYENGIKDEKNIWKNLSLTWHNQGREEGESQLVKLINSMIAGGDGDKIASFGEPEILKTMKQKYGINWVGNAFSSDRYFWDKHMCKIITAIYAAPSDYLVPAMLLFKVAKFR